MTYDSDMPRLVLDMAMGDTLDRPGERDATVTQITRAPNIVIDDAIYKLQRSGGISTVWRAITPLLRDLLPECTFDPNLPADVYLPTYYSAAPEGAKSVVMVYDFIHERYPHLSPYAPEAIAKREAIASSSAVIAISEWTAQDVDTYRIKPYLHRATVAYPATSLERATQDAVTRFRVKYQLLDTYVIISGNRRLYKNVSTYYQALRLLGHNAPYTLCIGGEPEQGLEAHQANYQWQRVHLEPDEIATAYTGALCLMYPSLYEGFGLPVLEAYACGCPVICGDGGALAEINQAAYVVDVTRPTHIAAALMDMHDPSKRIEYIVQGYKEVKRFSWLDMATKVAGVIREVLERETV